MGFVSRDLGLELILFGSWDSQIPNVGRKFYRGALLGTAHFWAFYLILKKIFRCTLKTPLFHRSSETLYLIDTPSPKFFFRSKIVWTVPGFWALGLMSLGQNRWDWQSRPMLIPGIDEPKFIIEQAWKSFVASGGFSNLHLLRNDLYVTLYLYNEKFKQCLL